MAGSLTQQTNSSLMIRIATTFATASLLLAFGLSAHAQRRSDDIRVNQIGFYPAAPKAAVVVGAGASAFHVLTANLADTVFSGRLGEPRVSQLYADTTRIADFSAVNRPGTYVIAVPGKGHSYPFEIKSNVYADLAQGALKAFYFQRASAALPAAYAGDWARPSGHPDDRVIVHPSAASPGRPAGTVISAPRGWYDAGDYNKYIVNSGITVGTLLSFFEDFPEYARALKVNIPESGNSTPDLLDEVRWNLDWMLAMQDPADGGVYHKLTEPRFEGFVMPADAKYPRYVVQKGTAATLDFAATMAQASRVFRPFDRQLAGSALAASLRAWNWARRNPNVLYEQNRMNEQFDPDVSTGAYGDRNVQDEWIWAASELYATTRQDSFRVAVPLFPDDQAPLPSWNQVRTLGYYTLARTGVNLPEADRARVRRALIAAADSLIARGQGVPFGTVMGGSVRDYAWGSSSVAANQGIALLTAYRLTRDPKYLRHALSNVDYLLGRNATGFSFVTGFGDRTPLHIHHRPSGADDVVAPVPGLLSGGPNPGRQDRGDCKDAPYPSEQPDKAFLDHLCSYASNEIAINWQAPLVYLIGAVEALQPDIARVR